MGAAVVAGGFLTPTPGISDDSVWGMSVLVGLVGLTLVAAFNIDRRAVLEMFINCEKRGVLKEQKSLSTHMEILRMLNWILSWVFLISSTQLLASFRQGYSAFASPGRLIAVCLSLLYLLAFFGVSVIYHFIDEDPPLSSADKIDTPAAEAPSMINRVISPISYVISIIVVTVPIYALIALFVRVVPSLIMSFLDSSLIDVSSSSSSWFSLKLFNFSISSNVMLSAACCYFAFLVFRERKLRREFEATITSKLEASSFIEKEKIRLDTYPSSFPTGWYRLCRSEDVKKGDVVTIKCLNREFVVFRGKDNGLISVMDAYCPHLGAHLGVGGKVVGDEIECPFHQWRFLQDGKCSHIPYCSPVPEAVKSQTFHAVEYYGMIMMWFSHELEATDPSYLPPPIPDIDDGRLKYAETISAEEVRMHLQEFAENSADPMHFQPLHDRVYFPFTQLPIPLLRVQHLASWSGPSKAVTEDRSPAKESVAAVGDSSEDTVTFSGPHIATFRDQACLKLFNKEIKSTKGSAVITFIGPGSLSYFRFYIPFAGRIHLFQTMTPLSLMLQKTDFEVYADPKIPRIVLSYVVGNWVNNWRQDIRVWENKIFRVKPMLVKGDGPFMAMRRWYKQFYPASTKVGTQLLYAGKKEPTDTDRKLCDEASTPTVESTTKLCEKTVASMDW